MRKQAGLVGFAEITHAPSTPIAKMVFDQPTLSIISEARAQTVCQHRLPRCCSIQSRILECGVAARSGLPALHRLYLSSAHQMQR
jgi:hypothetical protein